LTDSDPAAAAFGRVEGTVTTFDEFKGYGTVRTSDGIELFFHCTALTDGSRSVEVGASVRADVVPGRSGRWEATRVVRKA
jgi:cold shock CspA family protein